MFAGHPGNATDEAGFHGQARERLYTKHTQNVSDKPVQEQAYGE